MPSSNLPRFTRATIGIVGTLILLTIPTIGLPFDAAVDNPSQASRFQILGDLKGEAVLDRETQLIWERSPSSTETSWANASLRCMLSSFGGRIGWRLPSFFELMTLVEPSPLATANRPSLPAGHPFRGVRPGLYWTSDSQNTQPTHAYAVDFLRGDLASHRKNETYASWCVRGGPSAAPLMNPHSRPQESI